MSGRKRKIKRKYQYKWTNRELFDLAAGLQLYGASEAGKISRYMRTTSVDKIKRKIDYVRRRVFQKEVQNVYIGDETNHRLTSKEEMQNWPSVRKWNKIAQNQIMCHNLRSEYSKLIIQNLCGHFYEEAEVTTDPQLVDVKAIYKFLLDCVSGKNPAELMPKESGIILMLQKKMAEVASTLDLDEERRFIKSFKKATNFAPLKAKDELEKETNKEGPAAVYIPDDVYTLLSYHRQLIQSFNPLMVPIWQLDKEQTAIHQAIGSPAEE